MKYRFLQLLLVLFVFGCTGAINSQTKDQRNVLDYYKLLPISAVTLPINSASTAESKSVRTKVVINDTKNGYLKLEGAMEGWVEVALFRKQNGSAVMVVGETGCGPACATELLAFELINGKMTNVTAKVIPKFFDNEIEAKLRRLYKDPKGEYIDILDVLPRKGSTINVVHERQNRKTIVYGLEWKDDRFFVKRSVSDLYSIFPGNVHQAKMSPAPRVLIDDAKNGYLKIRIPAATVEVGLFRKRDGSPVLLVVENYCGTGRCVTSEMEVRQLVGNRWVDIAGDVLPKGLNEEKIHSKSAYAAKHGYQYKVPRIGKTVRIVEGTDGKTIYRLLWRNDKFVIGR